MTQGEADRLWFLQFFPDASENDIEWFLERVGIRCDSGFNSMQARNLTHSEFLIKRKIAHE